MVRVHEHGRRRAVAADHFHDPAVAHLRKPAAAPFPRQPPCPSTPSSARPSITDRGMSASRSIAAASMCAIGEITHRRHGLLDDRLARLPATRDKGKIASPTKLAAKERLRKPSRWQAPKTAALQPASCARPEAHLRLAALRAGWLGWSIPTWRLRPSRLGAFDIENRDRRLVHRNCTLPAGER